MFGMINGLFGVVKPLGGLAGWFIRLPFAGVFLYHGITKFTGGIEGFAGNLDAMGAMALPVAILVAGGEVLAGVGIIIGGLGKSDMSEAATRLAGLAAFPIMLGAIFMVHWSNGWNVFDGGMEFQVVLAGIALYYMVRGND